MFRVEPVDQLFEAVSHGMKRETKHTADEGACKVISDTHYRDKVLGREGLNRGEPEEEQWHGGAVDDGFSDNERRADRARVKYCGHNARYLDRASQ